MASGVARIAGPDGISRTGHPREENRERLRLRPPEALERGRRFRRTLAAGPRPDEVGPEGDRALHEERAPVVADQVDGLAHALDLRDEPVDVVLLGRLEARRQGDAEAGQARRHDVATREMRAELVP